MTLPAEICGLVCTDPTLKQRDLRALCSVSRSFRNEAERTLYISIRLKTHRQITSWCISIARRSHLAQRVKIPSITMPAQTSLEAEDLSRITNALRQCVNLRELSMLNGKPTSGDAVQSWILLSHKFTLEKFTNTYFRPMMLVSFLESQPSLSTLSLRTPSETRILEGMLPNLTTLDTSARVVRELGRTVWKPWSQIKRLQYVLENPNEDDELATFVALSRFGPLDSLSIKRWPSRTQRGIDVGIIASSVAAQMPELKYLRIMDYTCLRYTYEIAFLPFSMRFQSLETLVIRPAIVNAGDNLDLVCAYPDLLMPGRRLETAERIMNGLPTLKLLVLMLPKKDFGFTRTEVGTVVQNEVDVDDEAWMKVQQTAGAE